MSGGCCGNFLWSRILEQKSYFGAEILHKLVASSIVHAEMQRVSYDIR
jgi:hypothetical protein